VPGIFLGLKGGISIRLTTSPLLAECLENVGASTSHSPIGLHGPLQGMALPFHAVKAWGGTGGVASAFLTSALDGCEWSVSRPSCFIPEERVPGTHWIGDWVGPRAGLDAVE
jgi:hypothetical protein